MDKKTKCIHLEDTLTYCLVGKVFKRVGSDLAGVTDVIVRGNIDKVTGDIYGTRKTESVLHNVNASFAFFRNLFVLLLTKYVCVLL